MARLAVVGGHNLLGTEFAVAARRTDVPVDGAVDGATVGVLDGGSFVVMQRHGLGDYVQPHHIDYIANMRALRELGCDRVLAIGSVGSLRLEHPVGTFIAPSDFIALTSRPVTVSAGEGGHLVPAFDSGWRARVLTTWNAVRDNDPVIDGGVYWETTGPRFETPAEIRLLASFADVVGMTVASECTAACGAGARVRAGVHRRQPRQRARRRSSDPRRVRGRHRREPHAPARTSSRSCSRSW